MLCNSSSYVAGQSCRLGHHNKTQFKSSLEVFFSLIPDSTAALGILNETASLENISLFFPHAISIRENVFDSVYQGTVKL